MEQLSALAFKAYRGLVYETEGFADYFWASTVITEIATLNIGSRPASRKKTREIEDLRAIPWVFSWAQCRLMLPGWYGFGSAVETWIAEHPDKGMPFLKELYREWPFFRTLLSNMDMVLAKSSIAIASRYAELVPDAALREKIFGRIRRGMAHFDRDAAGHHGAGAAVAGQPAAGALDPQPLSLSRSAEPRAGGIAEGAPRAESRTNRYCAASSSPSTAFRRGCGIAGRSERGEISGSDIGESEENGHCAIRSHASLTRIMSLLRHVSNYARPAYST